VKASAHDRVVVVEIPFEASRDLIGFGSRRYSESAEVVAKAAIRWSDEIGQRAIRFSICALQLLSQHVEADALLISALVFEEHDVVPITRCGPKPVDAARCDPFLIDDPAQQCLPVFEEFTRGFSVLLALEDLGKLALELPGVFE
jgi:hypothetical protein